MPIVTGARSGASFTPARNVGQASLSFGEDVTSADGGKRLTLAADTGDASMFDMTTPTYPKIVTPGTYAFVVAGSETLVVGPWLLELLVDDNFYSLSARASCEVANDGFVSPAAVWWCDAADPFAVIGQVIPGSSTIHLQGTLYVQRIA